MIALKIGTLEFINEVNPALKVSEAYDNNMNATDVPTTPLTSKGHQYCRAISLACFRKNTGDKNKPANVIRNATKGTGPNPGAEIRMNKNDAPHRPARNKRIKISPIRTSLKSSRQGTMSSTPLLWQML
jgi:hypothetical protein